MQYVACQCPICCCTHYCAWAWGARLWVPPLVKGTAVICIIAQGPVGGLLMQKGTQQAQRAISAHEAGLVMAPRQGLSAVKTAQGSHCWQTASKALAQASR